MNVFTLLNDCPSILDQLQVVFFEHRQKYVQFVVIFHLFTHGRPMIDYKDLKDLFQLFKVKSVSRKHWSDTSGWGMVEVMHIVLLEATKVTFVIAPFIVVGVDEITTINNT
jgi:hypothetical protein